MEWHEAIVLLRPHIFNISTPNGTGTGWLVSLSKVSSMCAIATAAHVVDYAHYWELPIRLRHAESGKSILLRPQDRAINIESNLDTAALIFDKDDLPLPDETLPLIQQEYYIKPGVEIGWLGYPAIYQGDICFFSGRVSSYTESAKRYLVDGVAINGVSGGPVFRCIASGPELIGVVSAYIANRATGETLPGVAVVQDVIQFHDVAERFRTVDEAKINESPPGEAPPKKESRGVMPPETETRA